MDILKKILGIVWIALGAFAVYYLIVNQAVTLWNKGGGKRDPSCDLYSCTLPDDSWSFGLFWNLLFARRIQ